MGLPRWPSGQGFACQCRSRRRHGFNSWVGNLPGGGNDSPLQYSCLENSMDRGAWWVAVHGGLKDSDKTEDACIAQDTASQIGTVPKK